MVKRQFFLIIPGILLFYTSAKAEKYQVRNDTQEILNIKLIVPGGERNYVVASGQTVDFGSFDQCLTTVHYFTGLDKKGKPTWKRIKWENEELYGGLSAIPGVAIVTGSATLDALCKDRLIIVVPKKNKKEYEFKVK